MSQSQHEYETRGEWYEPLVISAGDKYLIECEGRLISLTREQLEQLEMNISVLLREEANASGENNESTKNRE